MAKVGEGDPRWVVKERSDGTNVGNWHWSGERDCLAWSEKRLRELLTAVATPEYRVTEVEKVEGDATLYNRKGQLKAVYDLKVSGAWLDISEGGCKGTFSFELFDDDPQISATAPTGHSDRKKFLKACGPAMRAACAVFSNELISGADVVELQDKAKSETEKKPRSTVAVPRLPEQSVSEYKRTPGVDVSSKEYREKEESASPLVFSDTFTCSKVDLFRSIVSDQKRLEALTRGAVVCQPSVDGKWEVRNGEAYGVFKEIRENEMARLDWRMRSWPAETPDCHLTLLFSEPDTGRARLEVKVSNIENSRKPQVEGFWRMDILQAAKIIFGKFSRATTVCRMTEEPSLTFSLFCSFLSPPCWTFSCFQDMVARHSFSRRVWT